MKSLFKKSLEQFPVFSSKDIKKQFSDFDNRRLVEWPRKGYIIKPRRGFFWLEETEKGESFRYLSANKMYSPSYNAERVFLLIAVRNIYKDPMLMAIHHMIWQDSMYFWVKKKRYLKSLKSEFAGLLPQANKANCTGECRCLYFCASFFKLWTIINWECSLFKFWF